MHMLTCTLLSQMVLIFIVPQTSGQRKTYYLTDFISEPSAGGSPIPQEKTTHRLETAYAILKLSEEVQELRHDVKNLKLDNKELAKTKRMRNGCFISERRAGCCSTLQDDPNGITKLEYEIEQLKANVESLILENKNLVQTEKSFEEMKKISDTIPLVSEEGQLTDDWGKLVDIIRKLEDEKKRNNEAGWSRGITGGPEPAKWIARDEDDAALRNEWQKLAEEKRKHEIARAVLNAEKRELEKENKKKKLIAEMGQIDTNLSTKKAILALLASIHESVAVAAFAAPDDQARKDEAAKSQKNVDLVKKEIEELESELHEVKRTLKDLEKKS